MEKEISEYGQKKQILAFNLLNEELGLDISCVREVLRPQEIHPLPQAPDFIEGVINLRGLIIAVVDLRKRFNMKAQDTTSQMRIVVCKIKMFIIGLIVDSVREVMSLSERDIQPTPEVISIQNKEGCISGIARIGERVIAILNLEEIFTKEEINKLPMIKK